MTDELEIKNIDENGNELPDIDWSKWHRERVEEIYDDDGNLSYILSHCIPTPQEELDARAALAEAETLKTQMQTAAAMCVMSLDLDDEQALSVSLLFDEWAVDKTYVTGDIRRYEGNLYRALQDSTAQAEHTPDVATSLWKQIGEPDDSGVYPWVQPLGATDAYAKGDVVSHNDKIWVSDVDANVWEPGVYGWTEQA